jgi:serine protease Do
VTVTARAAAPARPPATGSRGVADLVAAVAPAVVNVHTRGYDGSVGEGSGVVVDRRGLVVTNDHVVRGARTVTVRFADGRHRRPVRGEVIGASATHDLAVIRVPASGLTALPLGTSKDLRLGDPVVAIGYPLDLGGGPTVTQGIVSGLNRTIHPGGQTLRGVLQTDAAINPGNSGGALVDARGRVVGINTARATSAENIGFAIAVDTVRPIVEQLGKAPAGGAWLGATFADVASADQAAQLGLPTDVRGAVAESVFADGPAAKAGLREGDVVVDVAGRAVRSAADLSRATAGLKVGARVALDVVDQSGPRRITITVGRRPATLSGR